MHRWLVPLLLLAGMAGCLDGDPAPEAVFSYTAPEDPRTEPFTFRADVPGDRFVWDFGDGRPPAEGAEVEHVFGAKAGFTQVRLSAFDGEVERRFDPVRLEVGPGENQPPLLEMQVAQDWVGVGQPLRLSGATSMDPDGDALLFRWTCLRESDVVLKTDLHGEARAPARPDAIPVTVLRDVLETPTEPRAVCDEPMEHFEPLASAAVQFSEPGIYRVEMHAKDPTGSARVGAWKIYVTPEDPPGATTLHTFHGNRTLGMPNDPSGQLDDRDTHTFRLPFDGQGMTIDLDPDGGAAGQEITYELRLGDVAWVEETSADTEVPPHRAVKGDYTLHVFLRDGLNVPYRIDVQVTNDLDPSKFWTAPH